VELNQLADATCATYPLPFAEGETISLSKQTPRDRAEAAEYLRQKRYAAVERGTGTMPLTGEMRGTMLAQVACTPITLFDLVTDSDARLMVLYLAAKRAGLKMPFEGFAAALPAMKQETIESAIVWVCNMEAKETNANPPKPVTTTAA
jgi:hypothetical protein